MLIICIGFWHLEIFEVQCISRFLNHTFWLKKNRERLFDFPSYFSHGETTGLVIQPWIYYNSYVDINNPTKDLFTLLSNNGMWTILTPPQAILLSLCKTKTKLLLFGFGLLFLLKLHVFSHTNMQ